MKRLLLILTLLLCVAGFCRAEKSYYINRESMKVNVGYTVTLHVREQGTGSNVQAKGWESSNPYVAWVDSDGGVHAECAGNVTVTAVAPDGSVLKCEVEVPGHQIKSIAFPGETVTIGTKGTVNFRASITSNADQKAVSYVSYDESVVKIDDKGNLQGIRRGVATIRATAANGLAAYAQVYVYVSLEKMSISPSVLALAPGGEGTYLECVQEPYDNDESEVSWSVADSSIAVVDENGFVTPLKLGNTVVTCTSKSGISAIAQVRVLVPAEQVEANISANTLRRFESATVSARALPENATDTAVSFMSADKSIAWICPDGTVIGVNEGSTVLYAVANGGTDVRVEIPITVTENPDVKPITVALTFDDGPAENTLRILDILNRYNVKATFFMVGENVKRRAEIVNAVNSSGHEIGNHTYSHECLLSIEVHDGKEQISKCDDAIKAVTGRVPTLLRAPGGDITDKRVGYLKTDRYFINWTLDSADWKSRDADQVYNKIISEVKDKDVILCHDLYQSTTDAIERLIPELIKRGCVFVTVSDMLQIAPPDKGTYIYH